MSLLEVIGLALAVAVLVYMGVKHPKYDWPRYPGDVTKPLGDSGNSWRRRLRIPPS